MTEDDLRQAAKECEADKQHYAGAYYRHLWPLFDQSFSMLEIGVKHGNSLRLWQRVFPNAKYYGIDQNEHCRKLENERATIWTGKQQDAGFVSQCLARITEPLGLVIDDGSHVQRETRVTFDCVFPSLRPGGVYVIEDTSCAYSAFHGGQLRHPDTMIEYLKALVDCVTPESHLDNPLRIESVSFHCGIVFIHKQEG